MSNPVFIHSLFRAGSTYIFNVFRRSTENYHCFQEPLNEVVIRADTNPDLLLGDGFDEETAKKLRHPQMLSPYYQELYEVWPAWKGKLSAAAIYKNYFAPSGFSADIGIDFWKALNSCFNDGAVVFQECRTSGRIRQIKESLAGYHIYLWRNPWDQWWSYKTMPYFDMANKIIIHADSPPKALFYLREELEIESFDVSDIDKAFSESFSHPLSSNQSYLVFYTLWCMALRAGIRHADLMINIDELSSSLSYQDLVLTEMEKAGFKSLVLSDCQIFQGHYTRQDSDFFRPLEERVEGWLKKDDWSDEELAQLRALRRQYCPDIQNKAFESGHEDLLSKQSYRMRELAISYEDRLAQLSIVKANELRDVENRANQEGCRANQEGHRANLEERRAIRAEQWLNDAESRANKEGHRANAAEKYIEEILNSTSWRVTGGLRLFGKFFKYTTQSLRCFSGKLLKSLVSLLRRNPKVFNICLSIVNKFPGLKLKLKKSILNNFGEDNPIMPSVLYYSNLSPRGREIYSELERLSDSIDE